MPVAAFAASLMLALPAAHAAVGASEIPKSQAGKVAAPVAKPAGDAALLVQVAQVGPQAPAKPAAKARGQARRDQAARALSLRTAPATARPHAARHPAPAPAHAHAATRPPHQTGVASYYARHFNGRRMANGEAFDPHSDSIAHRSLPFGTRVRITNLTNGRTVHGTVRDRGPYTRGRLLDVSPRIAGELGMLRSGIASVALWRTDGRDPVEIAEAP